MKHKTIQTNIKAIKIIEIDYAVGFRVGNDIYLNKKLKAYPSLRKAILKHELEHTDSLSWKDIKLDLTGKHLKSVKSAYWKFIINNPTAWLQFSPVLFIGKDNVWDFMMIMYIIIVISLMGVIFSLI